MNTQARVQLMLSKIIEEIEYAKKRVTDHQFGVVEGGFFGIQNDLLRTYGYVLKLQDEVMDDKKKRGAA